ncbi:MAG: Cobyrinic acid ac-diamide synthase [Chloroflexi bacterium]|nr:MAG: Cobyrinic acid ac-diamide synthase [Chloroflexota bacterium]
MKIFAFANQKGGVGKTTTAVTLADGLARLKIRTLLVDLDPQGHLALSFGLEKSPGLYRLVCLDEPLSEVKVAVRPYLDLVTGDKQTEKVKRQITLSDFRETILTDLLRDASYDAVLLDMAPSLDVLHINGLIAADWVVIPTRLDALAVDGVKEILTTMAEITRTGHSYQGYSILPTFFDRTTRETLIQFQDLARTFSDHVWPPIPQDTRVRETAAYGKTMWDYSPNSSAMEGYLEGRQKLGGYRQVLGRMMEVING